MSKSKDEKRKQQDDVDQTVGATTPEQLDQNDKQRKRASSPHRRRPVESEHSDGHPDDDRAVGYKSPPKNTRFQKGNQAARGRGRPKGSRNRAIVVKELADFKHVVTMPDGKARTMTLWEAGAWKLGILAAKGNIKALALLTDLYDRFGVALPETPALAEPLTQDEDAAMRQLFVDWAMENSDQAHELIATIQEQLRTLPAPAASNMEEAPQDELGVYVVGAGSPRSSGPQDSEGTSS